MHKAAERTKRFRKSGRGRLCPRFSAIGGMIRMRSVIQKTERPSQTKVQEETGPRQRVNFFLHDIMDIYINRNGRGGFEEKTEHDGR